MKQPSILLLLITTCLKSYSIEVQEISKSEIPNSIVVKGELNFAYKWSDINGINYLVLSSKGPFESKNQETLETEKNKYVYGEQYIVKNGRTKLLWDIVDFEQNCPFDISVSFLKNSIQITDLDNDGETETTIAYKLICRSDITPAFLKILMHEGTKKNGLRGQMIWQHDSKENFEYDESKLTQEEKIKLDYRVSEGRFKNTLDFQNSPSQFLDFAIKNWKNFCVETP